MARSSVNIPYTIVLKKFGEKYFKGAILYTLLDSFAPRLSKLDQADVLTFKAIMDYYRKELARCFDKSLFSDVFERVEEHLNEILKDIAREHKIVYRDLDPATITQIEIYYDSRTVDKGNLEFIRQALKKLQEKYKIKIIEKQIDKMSKIVLSIITLCKLYTYFIYKIISELCSKYLMSFF